MCEEEAVIDAMQEFLDFTDYQGGAITVEQIPPQDWDQFVIVDTRDTEQYRQGHIPGAINIEWRQILTQRNELPTDKPILFYCNTATLSAQAAFALKIAGYNETKVLKGGYLAWQRAQKAVDTINAH